MVKVVGAREVAAMVVGAREVAATAVAMVEEVKAVATEEVVRVAATVAEEK